MNLPEKRYYYPNELLTWMVDNCGSKYPTVRGRLYRRMNNAEIELVKVKGKIALPYRQARNFVEDNC